jgi:NADH dehydrogenase FAD-containing subunit
VAFEDGRRPQFEIEYDMVVVAVGEQPATFGVPGAQRCSIFCLSAAQQHATGCLEQWGAPKAAALQMSAVVCLAS